MVLRMLFCSVGLREGSSVGNEAALLLLLVQDTSDTETVSRL